MYNTSLKDTLYTFSTNFFIQEKNKKKKREKEKLSSIEGVEYKLPLDVSRDIFVSSPPRGNALPLIVAVTAEVNQ